MKRNNLTKVNNLCNKIVQTEKEIGLLSKNLDNLKEMDLKAVTIHYKADKPTYGTFENIFDKNDVTQFIQYKIESLKEIVDRDLELLETL